MDIKNLYKKRPDLLTVMVLIMLTMFFLGMSLFIIKAETYIIPSYSEYCKSDIFLIRFYNYTYCDQNLSNTLRTDCIVINNTETIYCKNGCDNITQTCSPPQYQKYTGKIFENLGLLGILLIIILVIILLAKRR